MPTTKPPMKSGSSSGSFLTKELGPLPVWGWAAVGIVAVLVWRSRMSSSSSSTTPGDTGSAAGGQPEIILIPPSNGGGGGPSGGGDGGGGSMGPPLGGGTPPGDGATTTNPTSATTPGVNAPANAYQLGQVVNAASGEKIIGQVYDPVYGWLDETSRGGVYGGGGGTGASIANLPNEGSYLGYVSQRFGVGTPAAAQEMAIHGQFAPGSLALLPGGGYAETNTRGETYNFVPPAPVTGGVRRTAQRR